MENQDEQILKNALSGDINAFQSLFSVFQNQIQKLVNAKNVATRMMLEHGSPIRAFGDDGFTV